MLYCKDYHPYNSPMTSKVYTAVPNGIGYKTITVEADANHGLPALNIIGMASRSIAESRDRIRSAIRNSGFSFPANRKIIINLAPADMSKDGTGLDLPIALSILTLSQQLLQQDLAKRMFVGELSLNGEIKPIKGIINIVEAAQRNQIKDLYIPYQNAAQAAIAVNTKINVFPVKNLRELWLLLKQKRDILPLKQNVKITEKDKHEQYLDAIIDQPFAKRALVVAVAGHHNILFHGEPGSGKTMLAHTAQSLLPEMSLQECIEVTKLHSISQPITHIISSRPFRAPHHSASYSAIIGGGPNLSPGEITLAHHGVLFLDEFPEFQRNIIEALRQPLEERKIALSRANNKIVYPADFMLIAAMNPCPCGYYGSPHHDCNCSLYQVVNYRKKLSGPLLDRIDMTIPVSRPNKSVLLKTTTIGTLEHANAKIQIARAKMRQLERYKYITKHNASLSSVEIVKHIKLSDEAKHCLDSAADKYNLSARAYFKTIKVARTIADLDENEHETIEKSHILEALQYRDRSLYASTDS